MEKNKNDHESHSRLLSTSFTTKLRGLEQSSQEASYVSTMTTIHAKFYLKDTQYRVHARILGTTLVMKVYHGYGDKVHSNLVNMNYATLEDAKREAPLHAQQYAVENGTSISNIPGWQDGSKVRPEWFYA